MMHNYSNESDNSTLRFVDAVELVEIFKIIFAVVGIVDNFLICLIFIRVRKIRTVTNYFIVNLAVADLIGSLLLMPFPFPTNIGPGLFSEAYCQVIWSNLLFWITIKASIFNLVAVTIERYYAIVYPISHQIRFTKKKVKIAIACVWCAAFLSNIFIIYHVHYWDGRCVTGWLDTGKNSRAAIAVFLFLLTFFIPVFIIIVAYSRIVASLKKQSQSLNGQMTGVRRGNCSQSILHARENVVKMLMLVVVVFIVCWAPDQCFYLAYNLGLSSNYVSSTLGEFLVLLAYCNSCINPIIYALKNKQFQRGFHVVFSTKKRVSPGNTSMWTVTAGRKIEQSGTASV
ncbi:allatostatin-A receptor-like [Saccoglossus kowalevskii]|uniref:Octopamine receptor 1-like n=1 Tax=Saccoglossus kowalevskii TaxID=10224 RepID=A0ABM0MQ32_SACKO|nr:PREDICTED: octopamine receptor 1-like [Saccoglossus kowalevskii]